MNDLDQDFIAIIAKLEADKAELEAECEFSVKLIEKLSNLLSRSVNVIKGEPPELVLWGYHDLPELIEAVVDNLEAKA